MNDNFVSSPATCCFSGFGEIDCALHGYLECDGAKYALHAGCTSTGNRICCIRPAPSFSGLTSLHANTISNLDMQPALPK